MYFRRYVRKNLHWFAAVVGCDISKSSSCIVGVGKTVFVKALKSFDAGPDNDLTPWSLAVTLQKFGTPFCRLRYSVRQVAGEICQVGLWFTSGGSYYNASVNVRSIVKVGLYKLLDGQ